MDPLNSVREKDSSEQISFYLELDPFSNHHVGSDDPTVDHHPLDDINTCIEYDHFMQILDEHNEPERAKKDIMGRYMEGSLHYSHQHEPNKMKSGNTVYGAIKNRKILQEDATESEDKWPKRKRFKKGSFEYVQRQELNKVKNRMAAARSLEKVRNHILKLERKAMRLRRQNDNRRKLLARVGQDQMQLVALDP